MRLPSPLARGRLIRRYKRFLADVAFEDRTEETVHTPNPGAMLGMGAPGMTVWCSHDPSPRRKLSRTWELVEADGTLVGVNTLRANGLAAEALANGRIPELAGYDSVRREVRCGEASRADFRLEHPGRPPCWVEVKSATLSRTPGLAEWPDCVSARAVRHLRELEAAVARGDRATVLFIAQRADCDRFALAADLDPAFARALEQANAAGVEALCYACEVTPEHIEVNGRLSVTAPASAREAGLALDRPEFG